MSVVSSITFCQVSNNACDFDLMLQTVIFRHWFFCSIEKDKNQITKN